MAKKSKNKKAKDFDNEISKLDKLVDFDNETVNKQANVVEEPVVEEPVVEEPVVEEPVVEEPVVEQPVVEQPVVEQPVVEEPIVEEPVVEQPVVEEPIVEQPVVEQPVVEEPIVEEPVVEEPVVEQPVVEEPVRNAPEGFEVIDHKDFEPIENNFGFEVMGHSDFEPKKNNFEFEVMDKSEFPSAEEVSPNANKEREPESKIMHNLTAEDIQKLREQGYSVREASFIERFVESIKQFVKSYTDNIKAFSNFISGAYSSDEKKEASPESEKNGNSKDKFEAVDKKDFEPEVNNFGFEVVDKKDFEPEVNNFGFEVVDKKDFEVNGKFAPNDGSDKPNIDEPQISQPKNAQVGEQQVKIEPAMVKKTHVEAKEELHKEEKKDLSETKAVNIEINGENPKEKENQQPNASVLQQLAAASSKEEVRTIAATTIVNVMESQSKEPFTPADRSQLINDTLESPVFDALTKGKSKEELSDYVATTNIVNDFANDTITYTKNALITKAATIIANEKFSGNILPEEAKKMAVTKVKTINRPFRSLTQGKSIEDLNNLINGGQLISEYEKAAANPDLQTKQIRSIDGTVKYQGQPREVSTKRSNAPGL